MKVQFVRDELYENLGRNQGTTYLQNSIHDFEPAFAERWLRRGAVKLVKEDEDKEDSKEATSETTDSNKTDSGASGETKKTANEPATATAGNKDKPTGENKEVDQAQVLRRKQ
jgi:hypothetical protein